MSRPTDLEVAMAKEMARILAELAARNNPQFRHQAELAGKSAAWLTEWVWNRCGREIRNVILTFSSAVGQAKMGFDPREDFDEMQGEARKLAHDLWHGNE